MILDIKPLSVNQCWQGKRFKTKQYKNYESDLISILPKIDLPEQPYEINIDFGFSSAASDLDNPVKPFLDILQKFYGFNDKLIYKLNLTRLKTKKGKEFINFKIKHYETI